MQRSNAVSSFSSGKESWQASHKPTKRQQSIEEDEKTAKKSETSSFDQAPLDCQVVRMDQSDPDFKISVERWVVEKRLLYAMTNMENSWVEEVTFEWAGWYKRVKVIGSS